MQPVKDLIRVLEEAPPFSNGDALRIHSLTNSIAKQLDQANNFDYRGWHVQLEVKGDDSAFSGHASLTLDGEQKCRLVLATGRADPVTARWALDSKARDYIDDWNSRRHTGNTDFGELGEV